MPVTIAQPSRELAAYRLRGLISQLGLSRAAVATLLRAIAAELDPDSAAVDAHVREAAEREAIVLRSEGFSVSTSMEVRARAAARVLGRREKTVRNWRACGVGPPWRSDGGVVWYSLFDLVAWRCEMSRTVPTTARDDV